ncbi:MULTISPECIES: S-4TM family putative pore-forming effector [unclassified Brevundimonas]|uniref:S-4TM family putative pore-forming effector n=1 Tax=unclassified Brevundimonas TaxID=2622653 RepID=UPI0025C4C22D|nr:MULTISPECIES: S-4TM family putative pore-forming effector [unclassified Brevundimonas]
MNAIPERQNQEPQLRLLRARKRILDDASLWLVVQFSLTVVMPMGLTITGIFAQSIRPWAAAAALAVTLLDVLILDRTQRHRIRLSAKIAEKFDEAVLQVPWNKLVAGKSAPYPDIASAERRWARWGGKDDKLRDWYPVAAGRPPHHLGRIICQRTNLWYDGELRRHYGRWLIGIGVGLPMILLAIAGYVGLTIDSFVTTVLAPAAPILIWSAREYFRQKDAADAQETLRGEAESLWEDAKKGRCSEADCLLQARELQNAIYLRRASTGLIFPGVYKHRRKAMEVAMNDAAEGYVAEWEALDR